MKRFKSRKPLAVLMQPTSIPANRSPTLDCPDFRADLRKAGFMLSTQRADGTSQGPWDRAEARWDQAVNQKRYRMMMCSDGEVHRDWTGGKEPFYRTVISFGFNHMHEDCELNSEGRPDGSQLQDTTAGFNIALILERYGFDYEWEQSSWKAIVVTEWV